MKGRIGRVALKALHFAAIGLAVITIVATIYESGGDEAQQLRDEKESCIYEVITHTGTDWKSARLICQKGLHRG